jgi:hypothetical protein
MMLLEIRLRCWSREHAIPPYRFRNPAERVNSRGNAINKPRRRHGRSQFNIESSKLELC